MLQPLTLLYIVCHISLEVNKLSECIRSSFAIGTRKNISPGYGHRIRHLTCPVEDSCPLSDFSCREDHMCHIMQFHGKAWVIEIIVNTSQSSLFDFRTR